MKWLPVFCFFLLACPAWADDAAKPMALHQQPPNVEIINGKKFFSLGSVRHFTGSLNSPRALSVMHHPRPQGTIASRRTSTVPFSSGAAQPTPTPAASATPSSPDTSEKVLSVFAPEDKSLPPMSSTK